MNEKTHLDLCSGIGGFALAIADAARRTDRIVSTIAFCEPDKFCQQVLGKHWPEVPIFDDVKTFPRDFGKVNILTAGYPCQPFSQAGKRKGTADDRHIWPWVLEITKQTRPDVAVFENVVGHISMGLDEVLLDLENEGYHAWPCVLGAVSKNAPHRRQRVWIVAYANSESEPNGSQHEQRMVADTLCDTERATHRIDQGIGQQYGDEPDIGKRREVGSHPGDSGENVADTQRIGSASRQHEKQPRHKKRVSARDGQDVADTDSSRQQQSHKKMETRSSEQFDSSSFQPGEDVADTKFSKLQRSSKKQVYGQSNLQGQLGRSSKDAQERWPAISGLGGTFDGLSTWVDGDWERGVPRVIEGQKDRAKRLMALGNSIVPQVASEIFTAIFEAEENE